MTQKTVRLFCRKSFEEGNFSIEASFQEMLAAFPEDSTMDVDPIVVSEYSNGILPRLRMIREVRRKQGDINHITGDIHFVVFGLPRHHTILTIHDCGFMRHPSAWYRWVLKWLWLRLPVRHCRFVTAVSEATRQEIIAFTGCNPDKIRVIPTVIKQHYRPVAKPFNANCPTVLHIGVAPNKNLARHIQALEGISCTLHIIGRITETERVLLERYGVAYKNEWNIPDEAVRQAYEACDLLLFASTLEGFGMPILEAQTVGRPVVTSTCSSMPEVAGSGACLVNPFDIGSIRAGVMRVIQDATYRQVLVDYGWANVQRFSPKEVALGYEALYKEI